MGMKRLIDAEHLKERIKSDSINWHGLDFDKAISMIDEEPTKGIDSDGLFELTIAIFTAVGALLAIALIILVVFR